MLVSDEEYNKRLEICANCELSKKDATFLKGSIKFKNKLQCGVCSCFISAKALFEAAKCPHKDGNKWQ